MKWSVTLASRALVALAIAVAATGAEEKKSDTGGDSRPLPRVIGVDDLVKAVDGPGGPYRVVGVVSAVSPKTKMLSLIDTSEFKKCRVTTCSRVTLAVRWAGTMPAIQDTVRLDGDVEESAGKLVFVARKLEPVEPPAAAKDRDDPAH